MLKSLKVTLFLLFILILQGCGTIAYLAGEGVGETAYVAGEVAGSPSYAAGEVVNAT